MKSISSSFYDPSYYRAAEEGNKGKVEEFVEKGGWIDMPLQGEETLLHFALKGGHEAIVGYLLEKGAHVYGPIVERTATYVQQRIGGCKTSLDDLLFQKENACLSIKERVEFINSIPSEELRARTLRRSAMSSAFIEPDSACEFLQHIEEPQLKEEISKVLIQCFLACGDIVRAEDIAGMFDKEKKIHHFSIAMQSVLSSPIALTKLQPALDILEKRYNLSQKNKENILLIIKDLSITALLKKAEKLPSLRGFIRCTVNYALPEIEEKAIELLSKK